MFIVFVLVCFFKQKTSYDVRIIDWSSYLCSSDLNCGAIANLGFIIGGKSVAVVDTGTTRQEGEALRAAVAVATDRPISHVVATHVHFDHCFGHCAFSDLPVRFVGHRNLPRALAERAEFYTKLLSDTCPAFAGTVVVPPKMTVKAGAEIDLGGQLGRAHV